MISIIAQSEGYKRKESAVKGVRAAITAADAISMVVKVEVREVEQ